MKKRKNKKKSRYIVLLNGEFPTNPTIYMSLSEAKIYAQELVDQDIEECGLVEPDIEVGIFELTPVASGVTEVKVSFH